MLRSEKLKQIAEEYSHGNPPTQLSKTKRREVSQYLLDQAAILDSGETTPAFRDGNINVCSGCGWGLERGCASDCGKKEAGFTHLEKLERRLAKD